MLTEGKVFAAKDLLKDYLLTYWDPEKSKYLTSCRAEGKTHAAAYLTGNTSAIEHHFLPYFKDHGITKLSDLTRSNLLDWRNHLFEKGTSPRVINRARTAVWTALHWAVKMGELPFHPGQYVDPVKPKETERSIFELAELSKLFEKPWPDFRCYAASALAATTGMRIGEVRGLLVKNLHLEEDYLDVVANFQDEEGLKPPKWDSDRIGVPLPPPTVCAIAKVLQLHRWGAQPEHFVFFSTDSSSWPLNRHALGNALSRACKAAGIPARSFHCFRHSFITPRAAAGAPIYRVNIGNVMKALSRTRAICLVEKPAGRCGAFSSSATRGRACPGHLPAGRR